ncbi:unnamed protein product [Lepeophtheirus salmonis]|uniref:(salmon louse) hypothetical protein n=1 Tax=Lepeophtheirus salmonis TaxID=72036 RepID=A0A7R8CUF0_LEPSM|nr:unnamed protein product [Lepeophtheirus salmonis]CAF2934374.1 unnamed protein product [Lepeophtheirus salmonis]
MCARSVKERGRETRRKREDENVDHIFESNIIPLRSSPESHSQRKIVKHLDATRHPGLFCPSVCNTQKSKDSLIGVNYKLSSEAQVDNTGSDPLIHVNLHLAFMGIQRLNLVLEKVLASADPEGTVLRNFF